MNKFEKNIQMENPGFNSEKKIKQIINNLDFKAFLIGLFGLIVIIIMPILTIDHFIFDYSKTGTIGDTIGGMTAPIIGFFSALLIYLSFRAQIKANYIVQAQIDDQKNEEQKKYELSTQMEIYKELKESFQQFFFYVSEEQLVGKLAIHNFLFRWSGSLLNTNRIYTQAFDRILELIKILINKLEISKDKGYNIDLIVTLLDYQFNQYIWEQVEIRIGGDMSNGEKIYNFPIILEIKQSINNFKTQL